MALLAGNRLMTCRSIKGIARAIVPIVRHSGAFQKVADFAPERMAGLQNAPLLQPACRSLCGDHFRGIRVGVLPKLEEVFEENARLRRIAATYVG